MPDAADPSTFASIFLFFHSLLRWGVLITVAMAGSRALAARMRKAPVGRRERGLAIAAMVLCHLQLVLGLVLYGLDLGSGLFDAMAPDHARYWKFEHMGMMLMAIALVTVGRISSKKARTEQGKHLRVAVFYLLALVVMLAMVPWPFTAMGDGRGWI